MPGRDVATKMLLFLSAACAAEPSPPRLVTVVVPRSASHLAPAPPPEPAAPYPEPAIDPAPVRGPAPNPTMASCLKEPMQSRGRRAQPFTEKQRVQLTLLLSTVEGQCMLFYPDAFWDRRPFAISPVRCKLEIASIYYQAQRWIDAAYWFRRAFFEHPGDAAPVFAYIDVLTELAERSDPKRPSCMDALLADLEPIACSLCQGGKNADFCLDLRRRRFDLAHPRPARPYPPLPNQRGPGFSCPNTHAYTWGGQCLQLPPIAPCP